MGNTQSRSAFWLMEFPQGTSVQVKPHSHNKWHPGRVERVNADDKHGPSVDVWENGRIYTIRSARRLRLAGNEPEAPNFYWNDSVRLEPESEYSYAQLPGLVCEARKQGRALQRNIDVKDPHPFTKFLEGVVSSFDGDTYNLNVVPRIRADLKTRSEEYIDDQLRRKDLSRTKILQFLDDVQHLDNFQCREANCVEIEFDEKAEEMIDFDDEQQVKENVVQDLRNVFGREMMMQCELVEREDRRVRVTMFRSILNFAQRAGFVKTYRVGSAVRPRDVPLEVEPGDKILVDCRGREYQAVVLEQRLKVDGEVEYNIQYDDNPFWFSNTELLSWKSDRLVRAMVNEEEVPVAHIFLSARPGDPSHVQLMLAKPDELENR